MVRKTLKWFFRIVALLLLVGAIFLINLIWFRPWSLNLFYEKVFAQVLFEEPELLSSLGLVEQFGFTAHNGKLGDASPAHQQRISTARNKTWPTCAPTRLIGKRLRSGSPPTFSIGTSTGNSRAKSTNGTTTR